MAGNFVISYKLRMILKFFNKSCMQFYVVSFQSGKTSCAAFCASSFLGFFAGCCQALWMKSKKSKMMSNLGKLSKGLGILPAIVIVIIVKSRAFYEK